MKKNLYTILIVFVLISVASCSGIFYAKGDIREPTSLAKEFDLEGIDGTPDLKGVVYDGIVVDTGNPWTVYVLDSYYGFIYPLDFECIIEGLHANIWIGLAPEVWDGGYQDNYTDNEDGVVGPGDIWYFAYPWTYEGFKIDDDYYLYPGYCDWITYEDLDYVLNEFDQVGGIHDTVVTHFGEYADRPGPENDYKIQILIFNIRDGLFWDPVGAPWFTEGYFWSYISELNNANIFHMDTYQWWRRLGDDPQPPPPYDDLSPKPNEYEGTFAHEFQHLVHYDVDANELSWVDEGCATLAEWLCGYGFSPGHISEYLLWFWDTPLTLWEGYLADYGASFLWTFYMYEHYGGAPLIWDLVHEQADGIEGWTKVLKAHYIYRSFDQIFQDWAIANYLDDTSFSRGRYGYYDLDIPSADSGWLSIQGAMDFWLDNPYGIPPEYFPWRINTYPHEGWGSDILWHRGLPYTVNYFEFYDTPTLFEVSFDGDDFNFAIFPHSGMYQWHTWRYPDSWYRMGQTFTDIPDDATLKFWTFYDIEEDWDYGYVEVHDLNTNQWYTLSGLGTVNTLPNSYYHDNPNCPDGFEPADYYDASRWNALTGFSGGWYQEEMDLSTFAGHDIEIYFTYWTDTYTQGLGWYIDDIEITGTDFFDDVESCKHDWEINDVWYRTDGVFWNDFRVSFINSLTLTKPNGDPWITWHNIYRMRLNDGTEIGDKLLLMINNRLIHTTAVMVVANQPGYEHAFGSDYEFIADEWHWCK